MKKILFILEKEFRQIFRQRAMLPIIFAMPVVQLLILSYAVDYEIKNLRLFLVDQDRSEVSRQLFRKFTASGYFILSGTGSADAEAGEAIGSGKADLALIIPGDFETDLFRGEDADVQLIFNAIDGTKAGLASSYALGIVSQYQAFFLENFGIRANLLSPARRQRILQEYSHWYNPDLNYKTFMVPGILVILVTMIGAFLSSMNIVREKEMGTIEQINVTPIKKYQFILGKTIPFWLLGLFELAAGLAVGKLVFDIPVEGSLLVLFSFAGVYLMVVLGMGLFISTITDTQQQAMFISWFFLVVFILMGGLFTAVENMPLWAQKITLFNPVRYFIEVIRMVLLKGSGFADTARHFLVMGLFALVINGLAVWRYRKTV
jgi:ABC-2 type transport system permease protein